MIFWLCGPPVLNGLVFITAVALCGVTNAKADQLPKFSQFPAREYNRGPIGRVDLSDPHAYSYRTRLREGVLPSVNSYQMEHEMDHDFNSIVFHLNSRLIVFAGQLNDRGERATVFMDFDGKTFRQVYQVIDKGAPEQPSAVEAPSQPKVQSPSGHSPPAVQTRPNERTTLSQSARVIGVEPLQSPKTNDENKVKHAIEAVARASIAQLYCKGAQFDQGDGEKILADAISRYGKKTVSDLETALDTQFSREALDNAALWCAETRNFVKECEEPIPLSFKDIEDVQ
jgi:hypothetical protein